MMGASQHRHAYRARELFSHPLAVGGSDRATRTLVEHASPIVDPSAARMQIWPPPERYAEASPNAFLSSVDLLQPDVVLKALEHVPNADGARLDSLDVRLIRQCPCPVWLADPAHATRIRRVLAAISPVVADRASQAVDILSTAAAVAATAGAELHVLHAWIAFGETLLRPRVPPAEHRDYVLGEKAAAAARVERSLAEARLRLDPSRVHIIQGQFRDALRDLVGARKMDLVVMGTRGRRGWFASALVRPYPEVILREVCAPLLVVKSGANAPRGRP
jgi:universal stress protein E